MGTEKQLISGRGEGGGETQAQELKRKAPQLPGSSVLQAFAAATQNHCRDNVEEKGQPLFLEIIYKPEERPHFLQRRQ